MVDTTLGFGTVISPVGFSATTTNYPSWKMARQSELNAAHFMVINTTLPA